MSRKLAIIVATVAVCLAAVPITLGAPPTGFPAGSSGLGDPYFPLDGNGGYDVQHYDLALTYDPATDRLIGVATITARATQNLSAFNLDFIGLKLRSLTVNGTRATTHRKGQELTVKQKDGLTSGSTFTVVARYDGVPEPIFEEGLGDLGFLPTEDGAIVQGEPHVAATWFPANDHPRDKASFTFHITVPTGLEAISNGVLVSQQANGAWTTWNWDAVEPMAPYLAMMAIDDFEVSDYEADGIAYWDAVDADLLTDIAPAVAPVAGSQFLYSQIGEPAYKRLTQTIAVPTGGATMSFQINRDTETDWDFIFVEARTAGGEDWTTLPDANGHTSQATGACPFNYRTSIRSWSTTSPRSSSTPEIPRLRTMTSTSATPLARAASGTLPPARARVGRPGPSRWPTPPGRRDRSKSRSPMRATASSRAAAWSSTRSSSRPARVRPASRPTATPLDGWTTPPAPEGSEPNPNTWAVTDFVPAIPGVGTNALPSLDRQPEIIAWESGIFGPYPFSAAGGIVHDGAVGFALENQTRPNYSPFFFFEVRTTSSSSTSWPISGSAITSRSTPGNTPG